MKRQATIVGNKTMIDTDFYLYLLKNENIIKELKKWLNEKWEKPLAQIYVSDIVKKIIDLER